MEASGVGVRLIVGGEGGGDPLIMGGRGCDH